jgi:hypothetical protein
MKVLLSLLMAAPAAFAFVPNPLFRAAPRLNTKLAMASSIERSKYCIPLENIRLDDLPKVGGKTASLGEMIQELKPLGVDVPGTVNRLHAFVGFTFVVCTLTVLLCLL